MVTITPPHYQLRVAICGRYLFQHQKAHSLVHAGVKDGDRCLTLLNLKLGCLL